MRSFSIIVYGHGPLVLHDSRESEKDNAIFRNGKNLIRDLTIYRKMDAQLDQKKGGNGLGVR